MRACLVNYSMRNAVYVSFIVSIGLAIEYVSSANLPFFAGLNGPAMGF